MSGDRAYAPAARRVLVTGADGFVGRSVVAALAERVARGELDAVWAHDVRPVPAGRGADSRASPLRLARRSLRQSRRRLIPSGLCRGLGKPLRCSGAGLW